MKFVAACRLLPLLATAAVALGATGAASAAGASKSERGVVQSVDAQQIVLKALDGSIVTVAVDERTRVTVDGRPGSLQDVRPGYVAVVSLRGASGGPATKVEAFTTSSEPAPPPISGVVLSASPARIVLAGRGTARFTVSADSVSRVLADGRRASLGALRPGWRVVVRANAGESEVHAFSPPRGKGAQILDGVITALKRYTLVVRPRAGATRRIAFGSRTAVFLNGRRASAAQLGPGQVVVVRTGPRREIWAFSAP